jgi:uncharacterized protein (DUF779 family)
MTTVTATPAARAAVRALSTNAGPVVVVSSGRYGREPLCFGAADYVPGPHDVPAGSVEGCAVYLDGRDRWPERLILDLAPGRVFGFVLRPAGAGAQRPTTPGRMTVPGPSAIRKSSRHSHSVG